MVKVVEKNARKIIWEDESKGLKILVKLPDAAEGKELSKIYNKAFKEALENGCLLNAKVEQVARDQKIWDDDKEKESVKYSAEIKDLEYDLKRGGNAGLTLNKGKEIALRLAELREKIRNLLAAKNLMYEDTVEARAINERFNYAVYLCTKNLDGTRYYPSFEKYTQAYEDGDDVALQSLVYLRFLEYGVDPDYFKNLPESQFLKKYKFLDDNGNFLNKEGKLVNSEGKRVDEKGRLINEEGKLIDSKGRLIDEQGNYIVEFAEFLEDAVEPNTEAKRLSDSLMGEGEKPQDIVWGPATDNKD